jgi:hypothetical protein
MILMLQGGRAFRSGSRSILVNSLEEASSVYCQERDAAAEGASAWPNGLITDSKTGLTHGYVSFNGRIWATRQYAGDSPIYSPF